MLRKLFVSVSVMLFAALSLGGAASAGETTLNVTGIITSIYAEQNSGTAPTPVAVPTGVVHLGDSFSLIATFNLAEAQITALYDADPTINIYELPGATVTLNMGGYNQTFMPMLEGASDFQIWDNFSGFGSMPADAEGFEFQNYNPKPDVSLPFDVGTGLNDELINFAAFDYSATARSNDFISTILPLSKFGSQIFTYSLYNADTKIFVGVTGAPTSASLTISGVPEPASWAIMLIGFVGIGFLIRFNKRTCRATV